MEIPCIKNILHFHVVHHLMMFDLLTFCDLLQYLTPENISFSVTFLAFSHSVYCQLLLSLLQFAECYIA